MAGFQIVNEKEDIYVIPLEQSGNVREKDNSISGANNEKQLGSIYFKESEPDQYRIDGDCVQFHHGSAQDVVRIEECRLEGNEEDLPINKQRSKGCCGCIVF